MKKINLIFLSCLALAFFSCDNNDDVENVLNEDQVVLKNSVETVVASEESAESVLIAADYETDLYSFAETEFSEPTSVKTGYGNHYAEMFRMWNRYRNDQIPNVNIAFGNDGRFPMTIVIDYGDSTVLNNDRVISGTITIVMTAPACTDGAVREITYDLMIDSISIDGWKRFEFTGEQGISKKFTITSELTFGFPDGTELFRTEERTREWVAGLDTKFDMSDDKIEIRGSVTCVDSEGNEYSKIIDEENPLVRIGTCKIIVSGIVIFSQNQIEFARLDYGDGECDNIATYTYVDENGETVTKEIEIGKHQRYLKR